MDPSHLASVQAIAALEEPTRRQLYELVARSATPISKDDAATALAIPRTTAAFHLDKLVSGGLLSVVYERRSGRCGPGAGRPAKLYRRSEAEVEVSLPERTYATAGLLLAAALTEAESTGESPKKTLGRHAARYGKALGRASRHEPDEPEPGADGAAPLPLWAVLEQQGFEPREDGDDIVLGNCPFHLLAKEHTELVCGMNRQLLAGLLDGLGDTTHEARIAPAPGNCCVRIQRR